MEIDEKIEEKLKWRDVYFPKSKVTYLTPETISNFYFSPNRGEYKELLFPNEKRSLSPYEITFRHFDYTHSMSHFKEFLNRIYNNKDNKTAHNLQIINKKITDNLTLEICHIDLYSRPIDIYSHTHDEYMNFGYKKWTLIEITAKCPLNIENVSVILSPLYFHFTLYFHIFIHLPKEIRLLLLSRLFFVHNCPCYQSLCGNYKKITEKRSMVYLTFGSWDHYFFETLRKETKDFLFRFIE